MKEIEDSLRRLRTDVIDLYQVHWPDPGTPIAETAAAMAYSANHDSAVNKAYVAAFRKAYGGRPTFHSVAGYDGGIGGLTAAVSLLQAGFDVQVYEQARELGEVGAGINIGPNASRLPDRRSPPPNFVQPGSTNFLTRLFDHKNEAAVLASFNDDPSRNHLLLREERALRVKLGAAGAPGLLKPKRREAARKRQGALTLR